MNTGSVGFGVITTTQSYSSLGLLNGVGYTFEAVASLHGYAANTRAQGALIVGAIGSNQGLIASYNVDNVFSFTVYYTNTASLSGGAVQAQASSLQIQSGSWYHLVGVAEINPTPAVRIYINGVQYAVNTGFNNFLGFNGGSLTIGGTTTLLGTSPNQYEYAAWRGGIAMTRIYNRPLTANEILKNYNATKGRFFI
jgi:hypothetical protein